MVTELGLNPVTIKDALELAISPKLLVTTML